MDAEAAHATQASIVCITVFKILIGPHGMVVLSVFLSILLMCCAFVPPCIVRTCCCRRIKLGVSRRTARLWRMSPPEKGAYMHLKEGAAETRAGVGVAITSLGARSAEDLEDGTGGGNLSVEKTAIHASKSAGSNLASDAQPLARSPAKKLPEAVRLPPAACSTAATKSARARPGHATQRRVCRSAVTPPSTRTSSSPNRRATLPCSAARHRDAGNAPELVASRAAPESPERETMRRSCRRWETSKAVVPPTPEAEARLRILQKEGVALTTTASPTGRFLPDRVERKEVRSCDMHTSIDYFKAGGALDNDRNMKEASWLTSQAWVESLRQAPSSSRGSLADSTLRSRDHHDDDEHLETPVRRRLGIAPAQPGWSQDQLQQPWKAGAKMKVDPNGPFAEKRRSWGGFE